MQRVRLGRRHRRCNAGRSARRCASVPGPHYEEPRSGRVLLQDDHSRFGRGRGKGTARRSIPVLCMGWVVS
jgi:hypothetical protein